MLEKGGVNFELAIAFVLFSFFLHNSCCESAQIGPSFWSFPQFSIFCPKFKLFVAEISLTFGMVPPLKEEASPSKKEF